MNTKVDNPTVSNPLVPGGWGQPLPAPAHEYTMNPMEPLPLPLLDPSAYGAAPMVSPEAAVPVAAPPPNRVATGAVPSADVSMTLEQPHAATAAPSTSSGFPVLDDMDGGHQAGAGGRRRARLGSSSSTSQSATFFDTMQAVGLNTFPTFHPKKDGAATGTGDAAFFDGPVWEVMPEPADPLSPYVFDDVHALAEGFDPTSAPIGGMGVGGMTFLRSRIRGAGSDMEDEEMDTVMSARASNPAVGSATGTPELDEDDDEDDELGMGRRLEDDKSEIHAALNAAAAAAAARSGRAAPMITMKGKGRRGAQGKRERGVAPGRTPFVAGQQMNPSRFFIDVELTILPHAALSWLLEKVEAQEHSAKTCRYYLSKTPVCSACRDVFKAGRKLYENDGSVKCLYRALRLQACMDVGMRFDAVGGGAAQVSQDTKKRKKLKRQQRGAGKRQCSVGARMHRLLKILVRTASKQMSAEALALAPQ